MKEFVRLAWANKAFRDAKAKSRGTRAKSWRDGEFLFHSRHVPPQFSPPLFLLLIRFSSFPSLLPTPPSLCSFSSPSPCSSSPFAAVHFSRNKNIWNMSQVRLLFGALGRCLPSLLPLVQLTNLFVMISSLGSNPPCRWIVNFDVDFMDGLVLAALVAAHVPFVVSRNKSLQPVILPTLS